jgi:hypothetical protein
MYGQAEMLACDELSTLGCIDRQNFTPGKMSDNSENKVDLMKSTLIKKNMEIEKLIQERDEARREVCKLLASTVPPPSIHEQDPVAHSTIRGWNCFDNTEKNEYKYEQFIT